MGVAERLSVRIRSDVDLDGQELALQTRQLRAALLELDVLDVELGNGEAPDDAKGTSAVLGWLWVTIGGATVTTVVNRVADWAASNGRSVEITVGDRTFRTSRASREEQRELIDAFLAQLPPPGNAQHP
jgi:hypothetical protein